MAPTHDTDQPVSLLPFRSHTALLLATALPFIRPPYRHPVELMTKFLDFTETMKLYREFHSSSPIGSLYGNQQQEAHEGGLLGLIGTFITDTEGLLAALSGVCSGSEREIITMFLNLIRAKSFFENYGDLMQMFSEAAPAAKGQSPEQPVHDADPFSALSGSLTSILNSEQQETLELLKSLFETDENGGIP